MKLNQFLNDLISNSVMTGDIGTKYSRMDQIKFAEDSLLKKLKGYGLPIPLQNL